MKVTRGFSDISSGQMHWRAAGSLNSAPVTVCLHMMPKSSRGFAALLPLLAHQGLAVAPDYPGYGESDPFSFESPSIKDYANSIFEFLAAMNFKSVNLVGYHTGAMVAIEVATRNPALINSVACLSAPIFSADELQHFKDFFAPIPLDKQGTRFATMWSRVVEFSGPGMDLAMAAVSMAENLRAGERYEDGHAAAFEYAPEFADKLCQLTTPVHVLNVGDDLFEHTKRIAPLLSDCDQDSAIKEYQERPDWGHGFLDLWPQEVADILAQYYARVEA